MELETTAFQLACEGQRPGRIGAADLDRQLGKDTLQGQALSQEGTVKRMDQ